MLDIGWCRPDSIVVWRTKEKLNYMKRGVRDEQIGGPHFADNSDRSDR